MWEGFYFPTILLATFVLAAIVVLLIKALNAQNSSTKILIGVVFIGAAIYGFYYADEIYKEAGGHRLF